MSVVDWGCMECRLQWCGSWGYSAIALTRKFLSYYVRARHYAAILGNWTSVDPLWPQEMAYGYVENRVMTDSDPSGMAAWCLIPCIPCSSCLIAYVSVCPPGAGFIDCVESVWAELPDWVKWTCGIACGGCLACLGARMIPKAKPPCGTKGVPPVSPQRHPEIPQSVPLGPAAKPRIPNSPSQSKPGRNPNNPSKTQPSSKRRRGGDSKCREAKARKKRYCSLPSSCDGISDCNVIRANLSNGEQCYRARWDVQMNCKYTLDRRHFDQLDERYRPWDRCVTAMKANGCSPYGPN